MAAALPSGVQIQSEEMSDVQLKMGILSAAKALCVPADAADETIATSLKMRLDQEFGPSWNVVVGVAFSLNVAFEKDKFVYFVVTSAGRVARHITCFKTYERFQPAGTEARRASSRAAQPQAG